MTKRTIKSGQFRKKRGDTLIGSIEKQYKVDLGVRKDMKLSTYLEKEGFGSLSAAIRKVVNEESS